jgi:hypothetical protein
MTECTRVCVFHVVHTLFSILCHLREKIATSFTVLTEKGGNDIKVRKR